MSQAREAVLLAPGTYLRESLEAGISSAGYECRVVSADRLEFSLANNSVESAVEGIFTSGADALLVGDAIFPDGVNPDDEIREGVRRTFMAVKSVLRSMMKRRFGRLVLLAPPLSPEPFPHNALRGGLAGIAKSVAREVGSRGVTANLIVPGYVSDDPNSPTPYLATGRVGTPNELAGTVSFLLSEASAYMTGQILTLDGGLDTGYH